MLDILVGLDQKDSSQRYSWFLLGDHFRKMFRILRNVWFDSGFTLPRQFSELLKKLTLSTCRWTLVFQCNAWFDSGFMLMRQITEALVWKLLFRRRHRQWHVLCRFVGGSISRAVFSLVGRPMMLGIMAGMVQIDRYALLWQWHEQGWYCW